ncbi:MAG TPA: CDP-alcohol phosphatidyltransferase family protein [Bacteroidia bacterium]|nr:CDP-alcohol phosphatidyltransferase family protein [Bacteroidia bacterium]
MKFIRNNIPNAITSLNLYLGVCAIYFAFNNQLGLAGLCVLGGAVADFFDGMSARLLKSGTGIGKDLDSLADVVSFGVAPVCIYINLSDYWYYEVMNTSWRIYSNSIVDTTNLFTVFIPFLVPVFSAIRLAIFNHDTRQTTSFIGLPTPANGLMISSLALIAAYQPQYFPQFVLNPWFVAAFSLLSCFLLVMPVPLFSLKFKQWDFKSNTIRYTFLALAVIMIALIQFAAIPLIVITYILFSILQNITTKTGHEIHS